MATAIERRRSVSRDGHRPRRVRRGASRSAADLARQRGEEGVDLLRRVADAEADAQRGERLVARDARRRAGSCSARRAPRSRPTPVETAKPARSRRISSDSPSTPGEGDVRGVGAAAATPGSGRSRPARAPAAPPRSGRAGRRGGRAAPAAPRARRPRPRRGRRSPARSRCRPAAAAPGCRRRGSASRARAPLRAPRAPRRPAGRGTCARRAPGSRRRAPRASTGILPTACTASQSTGTPRSRQAAATAATGCRVPSSLLASIRATSRVSGRRARHDVLRGHHAVPAGDTRVTVIPSSAQPRRAPRGSRGARWREITRCPVPAGRRAPTSKITALLASVPGGGEDHLQRPAAEQRRHLLARLLDRLARRLPEAVDRGGVAVQLTASQGSMASRTLGWRGVVALWSK